MKLLVMEQHDGHGTFPLFAKGTAVHNLQANNEYPIHADALWGSGKDAHWLACVIEKHETYLPITYLADGVLVRDYNPTELIVKPGQHLTLIDLVFEWVYAEDEAGKTGWLPVNKVISVA
ncbi:MAG: SH3 domain-containing protein [Oscillospiraceae bacterium]|nr:SH3 domain-containing protein [Oscillospiraceae bacterium]